MSLALEYGYTAFHKHGEELCGDNVAVADKDGYLTLVLADGMGSGVRANILSTLTSTMLCTMITNNVPIEETVDTIIDTLPVSSVNQAAYSTFSVIHVNREGAEKILKEWEEGLAELNRKDSETCCEIACGFAFGEKGFDLDEVFAEADRLMYEDKKAKKQRAGQGAGR